MVINLILVQLNMLLIILKDVDYKENALKLQKKVVITYIFEKELTDYLKMMKIQVNLLVNK